MTGNLLAGKGSIDQLTQLAELGIKHAELYVRSSDLEERRDPTKKGVKLVTMHEFKGAFKIGGKTIWGNIGDNHILGDLSQALLRRHVEWAKEYGIPRLVLHPGFCNILAASKESAIETAAKRLDFIHDPEVLFCIENSEFGPETAFDNERLVVDSRDVELFSNKMNIPFGIIVDVEHLYTTAVFKQVYSDLLLEFEEVQRGNILKEFALEFAYRRYFEFANADPDKTRSLVDEFTEDYFTRWKSSVEGVHICGTDFLEYRPTSSDTGPLAGSHLPIGFQGNVDGTPVEDRMNYKQVMSLTDAPLIIEANPKDGLPFEDSLAGSFERLKKIKE